MCPQEEAREHSAVVALYRTHLLYAIQVSPLPPDSVPDFLFLCHYLGLSFSCSEPASWLLGTFLCTDLFLGALTLLSLNREICKGQGAPSRSTRV